MEKLDKERYLKRVIVVCWIALAICFGIKLFGGNLFEIMCNNENFIKVCNYADNHAWAYYLISVAYCYMSNYFLLLAMCGKWKFSKIELIIFSITIFSVCGIKLFSSLAGLIFDVWQLIIMPCVFTLNKPKRHLVVLFGNVMLFGFQAISLITRNLSFGIVTDNGLLIGIIYSTDVTLMLILYYLYSNFSKERRDKNGNTFGLASMRRRCRTEEDERKCKDRRGEERDR